MIARAKPVTADRYRWPGVSFVVIGQAVPKQSFRKTKTGGYTDPRVTAWQDAVGWVAAEAMLSVPGKPDAGLPLAVEIEFRLAGHRRVDLDNLSKTILDGMKGIVYGDDRDVFRLLLAKIHGSDSPHVWVSVKELEEIK